MQSVSSDRQPENITDSQSRIEPGLTVKLKISRVIVTRHAVAQFRRRLDFGAAMDYHEAQAYLTTELWQAIANLQDATGIPVIEKEKVTVQDLENEANSFQAVVVPRSDYAGWFTCLTIYPLRARVWRCVFCGKYFQPKQHHKSIHKRLFCKRQCENDYRRNVKYFD